jgi:hypothetical protein
MSAREKLPNRRSHQVSEFTHGSVRFTLGVGFFADNRVGEIFLSSSKPGSETESIARDGAILASLCLQHGCDIGTIHRALTKDNDGAAATAIGAALTALLERGELS